MTKQRRAPAIRLRGVRHNNLKDFDLDLPMGRLIVLTGLSGSGKSSLAFDTLYAEGQRRYIETFSPYARQFFDRMDKPQVDRIEGIPPAIAIEQRNTVRTTRSTVGTMTELCDYMKLLWPHLARLHCRQCGQPVRKEPPQWVWETVMAECALRNGDSSEPSAVEVLITFDLPLSEKLSLKESLALIAKQGYQRLLVNGHIVRLDDAQSRAPQSGARRTLTVVQDRLKLIEANRPRFVEACEQAYHFGKGKLAVYPLPAASAIPQSTIGPPDLFSAGLHCAACDLDYREPAPALFSFNHPVGACPACKGFGRIIAIDYDLAIPDRSKTLAEGAVKPWQSGMSAECQDDLAKFCKLRKVPMDVPFERLPQRWQDWVIHGDPDYGQDEAHQWPHAWYGVKGYFRWLESKSYKMHVRVLLSRYRAYSTCPDCQGKRLKPEALLYRLPIADCRLPSEPPARVYSEEARGELTLADFYALPVAEALNWVERLSREGSARSHSAISGPPSAIDFALGEVKARLRYLVEVGLGYLTLDRPTRTLSGGETERVNLTTCLGTRLVNMLYVLDEPSVGLHPRDTARLVRILENLRDLGNTVVVVEHEASVMRAANQIVDLGPGSGERGGQLVFQGTFPQLLRCARSLTGQYLSGRRQVEIPPRRPVVSGIRRLELNEAPAPYRVSLPLAARTVSKRLCQPGARPDILTLPKGEGPLQEEEWSGTAVAFAVPTLRISHAARHNLKDLTVEIPLGRFVCLTGVSGSGKTTLAREVLFPALQAKLNPSAPSIKASDRLNSSEDDDEGTSPVRPAQSAIEGWESLSQVVLVDQSPLGKTPRSNPVVYLGAFDDIRSLFAQTESARQRGLNASAFSFNSAQGQCERCRGAGFEKVEMQFLSDVFIRCPDCHGRRYRPHILEVKLPMSIPPATCNAQQAARITEHAPSHWSIADLLDATVDDALQVLLAHLHTPQAQRAVGRLKLLQEVGLGYLRLGQPINTLSGGESQRLKLVSYLAEAAGSARLASPESRQTTDRNRNDAEGPSALPPFSPAPVRAEAANRGPKFGLFIFDEPTTGLHFDDVRVLLKVFQRLVDAGHSLLVIEHNMDVIKCADWIIDLGPEAGDGGGQIVVAGTPEDVAACPASHTGQALAEVLTAGKRP